MLTKKLDIQKNSISIIDLLTLVQDNTEIVLTDGDMPLNKVILIERIEEKITTKAKRSQRSHFIQPLPKNARA